MLDIDKYKEDWVDSIVYKKAMKTYAVKIGKECGNQFDYDEQADLTGFISDNDATSPRQQNLKVLTENEIIYTKSLLKVENEKWDNKQNLHELHRNCKLTIRKIAQQMANIDNQQIMKKNRGVNKENTMLLVYTAETLYSALGDAQKLFKHLAQLIFEKEKFNTVYSKQELAPEDDKLIQKRDQLINRIQSQVSNFLAQYSIFMNKFQFNKVSLKEYLEKEQAEVKECMQNRSQRQVKKQTVNKKEDQVKQEETRKIEGKELNAETRQIQKLIQDTLYSILNDIETKPYLGDVELNQNSSANARSITNIRSSMYVQSSDTQHQRLKGEDTLIQEGSRTMLDFEKHRKEKLANLRYHFGKNKVVDYESDTIELYEMISQEFDYDEIRFESPYFKIKQYKDSIYRGEVDQETSKRNGKGVTVYDTGRIYEGQWKNDKRHGRGFELYANGNTYTGEYRNGKADGKGLYQWRNGEIYDGQFKNGLKSGNGLWKGIQGDSFVGDWVNNKADGYGIHIWLDGDKYEGQWKECLRDGTGSDFFHNGDAYIGSYHQGLPHFQGQYKWSNGDTYIGEFKQGSKHGKGKWRQLPSNDQEQHKFNQFEGQYEDDKKHGFGSFIWEMGNKYTGNYGNNERDGWGTMEWIDGSVYKGQWLKGIQQGLGIMTYNIQSGQKQRAGFFENNIFVQPLVNKEQIKIYKEYSNTEMPEDYQTDIAQYLEKREQKIGQLKELGKEIPSDSYDAFQSEDDEVGRQFKRPILDLRLSESGLNSEEKGEIFNSDKSDRSSKSSKSDKSATIYNINEEAMQEVQGMVEVGKQINPNQGPFINHEGLKRVYKPKVRGEKENELQMIRQISETQTENLKFIESLKEFIDPNQAQQESTLGEADGKADEQRVDTAMEQAKNDNIHQNQLYEESDHGAFTIETDFFSVKNTKVATPSLFVRRKVPGAYQDMECQTELDMATITRLSNIDKTQKLPPLDGLGQGEGQAPLITTPSRKGTSKVTSPRSPTTAQPNTVRNKAQEKIIKARQHVRQSTNRLRISRNTNNAGVATQDHELPGAFNLQGARKGKTPLKPLRERPVNNENVMSYPSAYDDISEITQKTKSTQFNKTMQGLDSNKTLPNRAAQINKVTQPRQLDLKAFLSNQSALPKRIRIAPLKRQTAAPAVGIQSPPSIPLPAITEKPTTALPAPVPRVHEKSMKKEKNTLNSFLRSSKHHNKDTLKRNTIDAISRNTTRWNSTNKNTRAPSNNSKDNSQYNDASRNNSNENKHATKVPKLHDLVQNNKRTIGMFPNNLKHVLREHQDSKEKLKAQGPKPLAGILKKPKPKVDINEDKVASLYMRPARKPQHIIYRAQEEEGKVAQNYMKALTAKKASLSPVRQNLVPLTGHNKPLGAVAGQRGISMLINRKNADLPGTQPAGNLFGTPQTYRNLDPYAYDAHPSVSDFDLSLQYIGTSPALKHQPNPNS